jgi:hypothetical protein
MFRAAHGKGYPASEKLKLSMAICSQIVIDQLKKSHTKYRSVHTSLSSKNTTTEFSKYSLPGIS